MLLLLKNLTIEGQKTQLLPLHATAQLKAATEVAISIGVAVVAGSGSGTGLKSEKSLLAPASSSSFALLLFKKLTIDSQKNLSRYCCFSHATVFTLNLR